MPQQPHKRTTWQPPHAQATSGYAATFTIPNTWFTPTNHHFTEREVASRRRNIRQYAKHEWLKTKKHHHAWHVNRYTLVITVAPPANTPNPTRIFPAIAAETCKPIIDAGTDTHLWDDDDSQHRYATTFITVPPNPSQNWMLTVYVLPIPTHTPRWEIRHLSATIRNEWNSTLEEPPAWYAGYNASFTIPKTLWLTSNITNSDLKTHATGKTVAWGKGKACGIRETTRQRLHAHALNQWSKQWHLWSGRFTLEIGVSYPNHVAEADPDNAAETANTILQAGSQVGAWDAISAANCKAVTFYRQANNPSGSHHRLNVTVTPLPDTTTATSVWVQSIRNAWRIHDERLTK